MSYKEFNDAIKKAGEETAFLVKSRCDDWFQFNADKLAPSIEETQPTFARPSFLRQPPTIHC
jgi:hypothetical protein